MRGLPFYVKREAFARADTRQRVAYILSAVLVITMLCVIFRFSATDAHTFLTFKRGDMYPISP